MYQTKRTFVKSDSRVAGLVSENPMFLLVLEHFNINYMLQDKTVSQICQSHQIDLALFSLLANIYNGFNPENSIDLNIDNIPGIIRFLKNSHQYYQNDKYPEIKHLIEQLYQINSSAEIKLVEQYFNEYIGEVNEHFGYEDQTAFPYFNELYQKLTNHGSAIQKKSFSVKEYRDHHTDIQFKLNELKSLLLKHIPIKNDHIIRRKLLLSLFEVEYDLNAHSIIESHVLIPLVDKLEMQLKR
jgi:regulator of cell morphogenesis and NO signaling